MTSAYERIEKGFTEAITHAEGKKTGARVHKVEGLEVSVVSIRAKSGLS